MEGIITSREAMGYGGMARRRRQAGLTIVELIVSLGVIAVALFAIMSMILNTVNAKESQRELTIAKQAATKKVEELKAIPWDDLVYSLNCLIQTPTTSIYPYYYYNPLYPFHVDDLVHPQTLSRSYISNLPYVYQYIIPQHPGLAAYGVTALNTYFRHYPMRGKGDVIIHGIYPDMTAPTLLDIEVKVEWVGVKGPTKYSIRSMYSK